MNFTQPENSVGISNEARDELKMDCAGQWTTLDNSSQSDDEFSQIFPSTSEEFNKQSAECKKADEYKSLRVKQTSMIQLDTCRKAVLQLKAYKSMREKKKDIQELEKIQLLKLHELNELKQTFGDDILEVGSQIMQNYEEAFKFRIIQLLDKGENWEMYIHFIRNGVAQVQFPVVLTVNSKTNAVVDVKTNLYTRDKLVAWLNRNNGNAPLLITNLGKILDDILDKYGNIQNM